jgi:uncharacterized protein (DUF2141 family)
MMKAISTLAGLLFCGVMTSTHAADVKVTVNNLKAGTGKVYASLCKSEQFMVSRCDFEIVRAVSQDQAQLVFNNLAAGQYAVSIFYDVNNNGKLDSSLFGIPEEPTGTSNNVVAKNGPPSFTDAAFSLEANQQHTLTIDVY